MEGNYKESIKNQELLVRHVKYMMAWFASY